MPKKVQSPHDKYIRSMMRNPKVVREFFEANLPPNLLEKVDLDSIQIEKDSFISDRLRLEVADMLFKATVEGEEAYFYTLLEHQSTSDKLLPFRMLKYAIAITEYHMEVYKTQRFPVIYPMVLYTGGTPYSYSMDIFFSLYLYALSQDMGVSRFIRWKPNKENTFIPEKSEKYTAAYDYFNYLNSKGANIRHKLNSGKIYELSLMFDTNLMRIFL